MDALQAAYARWCALSAATDARLTHTFGSTHQFLLMAYHAMFVAALVLRWVFPGGFNFFTNWAMLCHTLFFILSFMAYFSRRMRVVSLWLLFPSFCISVVVAIGVTIILYDNPDMLCEIGKVQDNIIAHHYLHFVPVIAHLALINQLWFPHDVPPFAWQMLSPLILPGIYRLFYDPNDVYGVNLSLATWLFGCVFCVLFAIGLIHAMRPDVEGERFWVRQRKKREALRFENDDNDDGDDDDDDDVGIAMDGIATKTYTDTPSEEGSRSGATTSESATESEGSDGDDDAAAA